jgi:hypothetical protein
MTDEPNLAEEMRLEKQNLTKPDQNEVLACIISVSQLGDATQGRAPSGAAATCSSLGHRRTSRLTDCVTQKRRSGYLHSKRITDGEGILW